MTRRARRRTDEAAINEDRSALRLALEGARGYRRALTATSAAALAGAFAEAAVLVLVSRLAFALASGKDDVSTNFGPMGTVSVDFAVLIAVALTLVAVRVVFQVLQARLMTNTFAGVWANARTRLLRSYLGASWSLQSEERDGRLQELVTTYASQAANSVFSLSQALVALLSLAAFLLTAFFVNAIAALVVVAAAVVVAFLLRPLRTTLRLRYQRSAGANLALATDVTEYAAHAQEIRVFNAETVVRAQIQHRIDDAAELDRHARYLGLLTPALYQGMALALVVGAVGVVYAAGVTRLASLGGIVLIMVRSLAYGQQLQTNYQALYSSAPYFEMLADEEERLADAALPRSGASIKRIGELTFDDVSYEYAVGRPVLKHLSFSIARGEIVGVVGPSGSGKSTLVQILLRLREPQTGRVLADGNDINEAALASWYRRVSFVPQDPRLFAGTVAENIRFYRDDVDDAAVQRAAKLANLHDEIEAMANGYDTNAGERGGHLSGGQRQRLAIARALAEEPDVLVLDEPTSSLDVRSEALIREALTGLASHTTVIIIAHRLSTLGICDRIMVVYDGEIQGFDTPSALEATNPFYQEALRLSGLR
jgi:ATP-binding cassette subfamily B protein